MFRFPNLLMDTGLTSKAQRAVLMALGARLDEETAQVEISTETLQAMTALSERAVRDAMRAIMTAESCPMVTVVASARARSGMATVYAVDWQRLMPTVDAVQIARRTILAGASRAILRSGLSGAPLTLDNLSGIIRAVRRAVEAEKQWRAVDRIQALADKHQRLCDLIVRGDWHPSQSGAVSAYRETMRSPANSPPLPANSPPLPANSAGAYSIEDSPQGESSERASAAHAQSLAVGGEAWAGKGLVGEVRVPTIYELGEHVCRGRDRRRLWLSLTSPTAGVPNADTAVWGEGRLALIVGNPKLADQLRSDFGAALEVWVRRQTPFVDVAIWDRAAWLQVLAGMGVTDIDELLEGER